MQPAVPTRITIELQPAGESGGTWTAAQVVAPSTVAAPVGAEPREPMPLPATYEPADCTCHAGLCQVDHGND